MTNAVMLVVAIRDKAGRTGNKFFCYGIGV
jgi:hypothetical protein